MSRKRGLNKSKVGFSVDIQVVEKLDQYCKDTYTNKSKLVNELLKNFLEEYGETSSMDNTRNSESH